MKNRILSLIDDKYKDFSKTFRIISDYIKYNYTDVSFLSIKDFSERAGVSTASISRYTQEMGFSGYQDFQRELQSILKTEVEPSTEVKNSILIEYDESNLLKEMINSNIKNLQDVYSDELYEALNKAVEMVDPNKRVFIIGLRSSFTVANYLHYMLSRFMGDVVLLDAANDCVFDKLTFLKEDDLLIVIGFSKYAKTTLKVTEFFKRNGNKIIAVTDSVFSPHAIIADVSLIIKNRYTTFSFVSTMTILNAFAVSVGKKNKEESIERIKHREQILKENDIHLLKG
ncbi:MurR/RpiR family transcriptional regulator [Fusibacter ferrireducens]|uniref:MurR/RpiR family transcriptional regulator n=1 Tax=Fusibacter ferrireducens TaxID=2785058 RepID=A0ABR9ZVF0_9FIRM|nr:MurR/RpiR family transcriptional regulator [Fusibacter ferrireducens]MBF4694438.1 MurR/RpiR family transcriptional regulator [Fusibacter ferrireducens]